MSQKTNKGVMTYLKPEVYESLKEIAASESRSISNLVAIILTDWINQRKPDSDDSVKTNA